MDSYSDNLRKIKSLLIVTSLQKRTDLKAFDLLKELDISLITNSCIQTINPDAVNNRIKSNCDDEFIDRIPLLPKGICFISI